MYNKESRAILKREADEELVETHSSDQDYESDTKTIQYAEPYRDTFTKKDEIYRKKAKKKAIKILNKKRKLKPVVESDDMQNNFSDAETTKKTKTIKVFEPKESDDLEITSIKPITHPRTKKQIKQKAVAHTNSAAVQSSLGVDLETLEDLPLLFNLRMTSEMEIEDCLVENLALSNDEYYIEHKQGTNVF